MPRVSIAAGVGKAALAAGPVFLANLGLAAFLRVPDPVPVDTDAGALLVIGLVTVPFGFALSIIPLLVGATVIGWLGAWNVGARLPVFWALAGGAMAGVPVLMLSPDAPDPLLLPAFAGTGALCALIARRSVIWDDYARQAFASSSTSPW